MMTRSRMMGALLARASLISLPLALLPAAAHAQAAPDADGTGAEIIVTGSRTITNGNQSPTPLTVVNVQALQTVQPSTLSDNLNQLPVFAGSRSQFGNPSGNAGAANQLNLRNLGANRNLLLFDGHRIPPTLSDGTVDSDMVPQMLIERVDMVTGGVSAVYGSDAISGVINFIPDRKFSGLKLQAQAGISRYGDGAQQNGGIAWGTGLFGGRGHFEASYEYRNDEGVLHRNSRPWNPEWSVVGLGTPANPYTLAPNVRLYTTAFGGLITSGALSGQVFKSNGVLSAFQRGTGSAGSALVEIGGDGAYYDDSMKAPLRSHQMFARLDYDLTEAVHAYVNFAGVIKKNEQYQAAPMLANVTMSSSNPFLAQAYRTALANASQSTFKMSEFMSGNAERRVAESDLNSFIASGGLEGRIGDYRWNLSLQHGWTQQKSIARNNVNQQHLWAALDAVVNPANGQIVCNVTLTNPAANPGCVPLNIFGPTAASAEASRYIMADTTAIARSTMDDAEFSLAGSPFDTWAGPLDLALSGEYRRQTLYQVSDAPDSLLANCTGLNFNCTSTSTLYQTTANNLPKVSQIVWEGAVEANVPLLKDSALGRSMTVNGAARYTSYKTSGNYVTWKLGLDWQLTDTLRLRATRSRDIRAPSLNELFAPRTVAVSLLQDLLTSTAPTVPLYSGGNPGLKAEIGHTTTAGIVWKPSPAFSIALDGYHIRITDALSNERGNLAANQQACYASGGASPYCLLQVRPNGFTDTSIANQVQAFYSRNINLAEIKAYGLDLEVNYQGELFARPFSTRLFVNHQPKLTFRTTNSVLEHAGVAYDTGSLYPSPKWSATALFHIKPTDSFSVDVMERWRSTLTHQVSPAQIWTNPLVPSFYTTNLNLNWTVEGGRGKFDFFVNVQNLLDRTPPPAAYYNSPQPGQFGGWAIGDDPMGRYFTFGVRWRG
ncbi:TonB-dependent receptor [Novosphingobium flavum]|uniref:TonB-dependent receptor n=1 Tax=Novosphingobium flavum TaxID=1778672 RepID=A0A7X1FR26_9SPHN|nr:TonB-dependent receptor [Novosphingobium flavum]MBC2665378.1 TonB-dependent receptor [Novosphingobium flavum]